jgi:pimeloyl-ACP methyl ester carboxylesterase
VTETIVPANGVDRCVESFGDPASPPVVLLAGTAASMDLWAPAFCRRLADGGRSVIRYDHRDTGRSVSCPPERPGGIAVGHHGPPSSTWDVVVSARLRHTGR